MTDSGLSFFPSDGALFVVPIALIATGVLCWLAYQRSGYRKATGLLELLRFVLVGLVLATLCQPEWLEPERAEQRSTLAVLWDRYHGEEIPSVEAARPAVGKRPAYWVGLVAIALGSLAILQWYLSGLKGLIDLATTISFLTAPVLAVLNHRAVFGTDLPEKHRPSNAMRKFSLVCIGILTLLACGWIWVWFSLKAG